MPSSLADECLAGSRKNPQGISFEHAAHMIPWEETGKAVVSHVQFVLPLTKRRLRTRHRFPRGRRAR